MTPLALVLIVGTIAVMFAAYACECLLWLLLTLDDHARRTDANTHAATLAAARAADDAYWENLLAATESDTDRECARFRDELDRSGL